MLQKRVATDGTLLNITVPSGPNRGRSSYFREFGLQDTSFSIPDWSLLVLTSLLLFYVEVNNDFENSLP